MDVLNTVYKFSNSIYSHEGALMDLKKDFGQRLKELRNKNGITQYQLAELVGIDPKHMSHIETGRSFPKADLIEKFAEALNVDYTKLFRTEHLQSRKILIAKINELLNTSTDEELKTIYKIVFGCID